MLQAVVQSYFSLNESQDRIQGKQSGIISNTMMSFGTFSTAIQPVYSWGVLRNAKFSGMIMDIDHIASAQVDVNNDNQNWLAFSRHQGIRQSANEHLVPEMSINDPNSIQKNVAGISAVKALQLANAQGQKIYQIDRTNVSTILPQLNHDSQVIADIRNAVAAGKVVTTSEKSINFHGWKGSGYIILDPNGGGGAYMISGGANGGEIPFAQGFIVGLLWIVVAISGAVGLISLPVIIFASIALFLAGLLIDKDDKGYFSLGKLFGAATLLGITFGLFLIAPIT